MATSLKSLIDNFEKSLRKFVVANIEEIPLTQAMCTIVPQNDNNYLITVTITGMGEQIMEIAFVENEFSFKSSMSVDTSPKFPMNLVTELLVGLATLNFNKVVQEPQKVVVDNKPNTI